MKRLIIMAAVIALAGCERETAAERTAAAHKVCWDAGLSAVEGVNMLGAMTVYCALPNIEVKP